MREANTNRKYLLVLLKTMAYAFCRAHHIHLSRMAVQSASCALAWTRHRQCAWMPVSLSLGGNSLCYTLCMYTIKPLCITSSGAHHTKHCMAQCLTSHTFECLGVQHMCTSLRGIK